MNEILKVSQAVKYYGNGSVVTKALNGLSFCVEKGEFVAVMGASGSGKSTLLNLISTIEPLSAGEIVIDGKSISRMKQKELAAFRRDKLGFVFQEYNLLDTLTVEENIMLPLNLQGRDYASAQAAIRGVAETLKVNDQLKKFPYELSGGQRQRVACARALIANPALVLADEPTGALDSKNSKLLMEVFALMNRSLQSTILMVTHDATVASYASRILFLRDGNIFSEIQKGDKSRREFYGEILAVTASLGGEVDVV
ncbi:MAG: ABC transporter ATP-binding protein [Clostridia bacterium]|nr:ABC transporter ATP-binding protein [Clostridia bacterium]